MQVFLPEPMKNWQKTPALKLSHTSGILCFYVFFEKAANMLPQPWTTIIIFQDKTSGLRKPPTKHDKKLAQINEWKMNKIQIFNQAVDTAVALIWAKE